MQNSVRPIFAVVKTDRTEFVVFFEHKKYTNKINCSLQPVELFTLHLTVYFVLFKGNLFRDKKDKIRKRNSRSCKKSDFFTMAKIDLTEFCFFWKQKVYN
jgi:hypothetical protein